MLELRGMRSTPLLPSLPDLLWPGVVAADKGPIYGLNRSNCILMLNWIVWIRTVWLNWIAWNRNIFDNETVLTFKLHAYAKLKCLKWNCFWHWKCTYIWWWVSSSGDLWSIEYLFIAITPRFTLTHSGSTC